MMIKKQGWKVTPKVALPEGYQLHEDTTGVYLYTDNELVANFSYAASPYAIKTEAIKHLHKKEAASNA